MAFLTFVPPAFGQSLRGGCYPPRLFPSRDMGSFLSLCEAPTATMKHQWRVFGYDRFAREEYFIGMCESEEEARRLAEDYQERLEEYQDEERQDDIYILPPFA